MYPGYEVTSDDHGLAHISPILGELIPPEDARESLARELMWKMEHLDPTFDFPAGVEFTAEGLWSAAHERDRSFCRCCVEWLLADPETIEAALRRTAPGPRR